MYPRHAKQNQDVMEMRCKSSRLSRGWGLFGADHNMTALGGLLTNKQQKTLTFHCESVKRHSIWSISHSCFTQNSSVKTVIQYNLSKLKDYKWLSVRLKGKWKENDFTGQDDYVCRLCGWAFLCPRHKQTFMPASEVAVLSRPVFAKALLGRCYHVSPSAYSANTSEWWGY